LFLALPVTYLLVRSSPREMGLRQDGKTAVEDGDAETDGDTAGPLVTDNWKSSFSSAPVWQLSLGFFVCGITTASVSVHYVRWAQDQDITAAKAAIAFGFLSAINAFSVIGVGWLSDRFERRTLLGLVYFVRGLAFLCFLVFPPEIALWAFAIVGGASWLATVPLTTSITADVYGVRVLGTLTGLIFMSHQLGGAAAVLVFGLVFDAFDSYDPAFAGSVATLVFAGVISLTIKERRFSTRYQHDPDASPAAAD
jgi:MFS family permease